MKVDIATKNPALVSLFSDPNQVITLDANFLIPPDRQRLSGRVIPFSLFQAFWLDPIFDTFPNLAIHEAVRDELVSLDINTFNKSRVGGIHQVYGILVPIPRVGLYMVNVDGGRFEFM